MRKHVYLIICLLAAWSLPLFGQEEVPDTSAKAELGPWGLSLGIYPHISTVNSDLIDYGWDLNTSVTIGTCIPLGKQWVLTGDLMLFHTGSVFTRPPEPANELIREEDIRDRFAYIHLSLGSRYYFKERWYVGAYTGPALHLFTERLTTQKYTSGFEQEERRKVPLGEGSVRELNWFASLGVGYEFPIGDYLGIGLEPTVYTNFLSIDTQSDVDARAIGIGLRANVVFKDFNHNIKMRSIPESHKARYINQKRKADKAMKKKKAEEEGKNG
jgi:hypothetical protein